MHTDKVCSPTAKARTSLPAHAPARGCSPERGGGDAAPLLRASPPLVWPRLSIQKKRRGRLKKRSVGRTGGKRGRGSRVPRGGGGSGHPARSPPPWKSDAGDGGAAPGEPASCTAGFGEAGEAENTRGEPTCRRPAQPGPQRAIPGRARR